MDGFQNIAGAGLVVLAQTTLLLAGVFLLSKRLQRRGPAATSLAFKGGIVGALALCILAFLPIHRSRSLVQVPPPPRVALFAPALQAAASPTDKSGPST